MSVQELKFDNGPFETDLKISIEEEKYLFEMSSLDCYQMLPLSRSQAHLLYLFLKERFEK